MIKYNFLRKLSGSELGGVTKSDDIALVFSKSCIDERQKLWVSKKFGRPLAQESVQIFVGNLMVNVLDKTRAAKTKFHSEQRGILSRIMGDADQQTRSILWLMAHQKQIKLAPDVQKLMLDALVYSIVIENSDISLSNIMLQFPQIVSPAMTEEVLEVKMAYNIDMEIRFYKDLFKLLPEIYRNPSSILYILTRDWIIHNAKCFEEMGHTTESIEDYLKPLMMTITPDSITESLERITTAISYNDFATCDQTKRYIEDDLKQLTTIYSTEEIDEIIVPAIDQAILGIRKSVQNAKNFLNSLTSEPSRIKNSPSNQLQ